jgi:ABC-2 type transport system permease protein
MSATELPSVLAVGLARTRHELRSFFRSRSALLFTLLFPVMLLILFGAIFGNEVEAGGVRYVNVLLAGILASGLASVSFVSLAISICAERDAGDLKRLVATPMPKAAYFVGKVGLVLVTMILELCLVMGVAAVFYNANLPTDLSRWFTFGWVTLLGAATCSILGVAMSALPRDAKSAVPMVQLPFVGLQFVSGVFVEFSTLPEGLRSFASLFPLKWIAQGYRSVFLPDGYLAEEPAGSWQLGQGAVALGVWLVIGCLMCFFTFRWTRD